MKNHRLCRWVTFFHGVGPERGGGELQPFAVKRAGSRLWLHTLSPCRHAASPGRRAGLSAGTGQARARSGVPGLPFQQAGPQVTGYLYEISFHLEIPYLLKLQFLRLSVPILNSHSEECHCKLDKNLPALPNK